MAFVKIIEKVTKRRDSEALTFNSMFAERVEKYNHNHDPATGRFTTGSGGGSSSSGSGGNSGSGSSGNMFETDTTDALDQITAPHKAGTKKLTYSLEGHLTADGKLTPEREAVHKKIIEDYLDGKTAEPSGNPMLRMMGGGSASGKSSVLKSGLIPTFDKSHHITVDPDDIKNKLPGYEELAKKSPDAASVYHEESSALAKRLYQVALDRGLNVTYDGTGNNSPNSVMKKANQAREKGYKVEGIYMTISIDEALKRNEKRYQDGIKKYESGQTDIPPRRPDPVTVTKIHRSVTDVGIQVASQFDSFRLYDNSGSAEDKPTLIAKTTRGNGLRAVSGSNIKQKRQKVQDFCDKGNMKWTVDDDGYIKEK